MQSNLRLLLSRIRESRKGALALRLAPNGDQVAAQQNREAVRLQTNGFASGPAFAPPRFHSPNWMGWVVGFGTRSAASGRAILRMATTKRAGVG